MRTIAARTTGSLAVSVLIALALAGAPAASGAESRTAAYNGGGSGPHDYLSLPGVQLFVARTPDSGEDLWRTDGTAAGTFPLDVCPGECSAVVRHLGRHRGVAYFTARDADAEPALWRSDGSRTGTRRVSPPLGAVRLYENPAFHLLTSQGRLFLSSYDFEGGMVLWTSDGTPSNTRATPVRPASGRGDLLSIVEVDGAAVALLIDTHLGQYEVWSSDGTPAGSHRLAVFPTASHQLSRLASTGERAVFLDPSTNCASRLWSTDGVTVPSQPFLSLPQDTCRGAFDLHPLAKGDRVYFLAFDADHDLEIYATDGSAAGTERLTDFANPYPVYPDFLNFPEAMLQAGGQTFFLAGGLWRTDGTAAGTVLLLDASAPEHADWVLGPAEPSIHRGELYLVAGEDREIWRSDGTVAGTRRVATACPAADCAWDWTGLAAAGDHLFLILDRPATGRELWSVGLDGGPLTRLTDLLPPQAVAAHWPPVHGVLGDLFLFTADDGFHGSEPWISDGTPAGTRMLRDLDESGTADDPPRAPRNPQVVELLRDAVTLYWDGDPNAALGLIRVEARTPVREWFEVATFDNALGGARIDGLTPEVPHTFRLRAHNAAGFSPYSEEVSATPTDLANLAPRCGVADDRLCFAGGRFSVEVRWRNQHAGDDHGVGLRVPDQPGRSGYLWFFRPDNVELIVKLLDGGPVNGRYWVFYGALTDVEYWITVTDHYNREVRTYHNPPGRVCGDGDTDAFWSYGQEPATAGSAMGPPAGHVASAATVPDPGSRLPGTPALHALAFDAEPAGRAVAASHPAEPCVEDGRTLCLLDGRFRVRVSWTNQHAGGETGVGTAVPWADRTGFFWFFRPDNIELVVKALDGRSVNGKHWIFYGALTDVGYTLEVVDTVDGHAVQRYGNPPGNLCGRADTAAF